ncbi:MAG: transglutaminase family protein [Acidobacteria bacterium]|nr:transglutaminase family protein [Acidobacteriota bacterium]
MNYSIRHLTKFDYSTPVTESFLETRMQPRSEGTQRCLKFELTVVPKAKIQHYTDYLGNVIHHFDIATHHRELSVLAESVVEVQPPPDVPESLPPSSWSELDRATATGDFWDYLNESHFARWTPLLDDLVKRFDVRRKEDPMMVLYQLNHAMYDWFDYVPNSTRVDSPIDHALEKRSGVCQDFAHIMVTLVRTLGIPARYVSGYVHKRPQDRDRSREGATHAWVEAWLPDLGWVGFDPTNALVAGRRHIRVAVGRDYADVPPTRGVYKGGATSELKVAVTVAPMHEAAPPLPREMMLGDHSTVHGLAAIRYQRHQQQQQQQQ